MDPDQSNACGLAGQYINAQGATSIVVDFWYRHTNIDYWHFELCCFDGTGWDNVADLGDDGGDSTWVHYTQIVSDNQYFDSTFMVSFYASGLAVSGSVWVDNVQITVKGGSGTSFSDGFESDDPAWNTSWVSGNWETDDNPTHSGFRTARSDGDNGGGSRTLSLDASGAVGVVIDFWYYLAGTDSDDFWVYACDGSNYDLLSNPGDDTAKDAWLHCTQTLTDPQYFKTSL